MTFKRPFLAKPFYDSMTQMEITVMTIAGGLH